MNSTIKTGIVLSGGGARGFAHIGVLKALNEAGIYPEMISAVSAGGIVGVLYADGFAPDEIFELFKKLDIFKILKFYRPAFGMLKADGLEKALRQNLRSKNLESLPIPITICATNFSKAKTEFFTQGDIVSTVLASSAIPVVIKPIQIQGDYYVDGGLMNNLPVEPLLGVCNEIIGVNVNPVKQAGSFASFRNYTDRIVHLALRANIQNNIQKCDVYIEPPGLMDFHIFNISSAKKIFDIGYVHTKQLINNMQKEME